MLNELGLSRRIAWRLLRQFVSAVAVPQLLFSLALRQGMLAALAAAGGWTALLRVHAMFQRRLLDPLSLYGLVFTAGQSAVSLAVHSPAVYAGGGVAENLLDGLGLLGSIAVCRPLLPETTDWIVRQQAQAVVTPPVRAALARLTPVWALGLFGRAVGLYVSLTHLTLGQFLLVSTLAGWPVTGLGVLASVAYVRARIHHAGALRPGRCRCGLSQARCAA